MHYHWWLWILFSSAPQPLFSLFWFPWLCRFRPPFLSHKISWYLKYIELARTATHTARFNTYYNIEIFATFDWTEQSVNLVLWKRSSPCIWRYMLKLLPSWFIRCLYYLPTWHHLLSVENHIRLSCRLWTMTSWGFLFNLVKFSHVILTSAIKRRSSCILEHERYGLWAFACISY